MQYFGPCGHASKSTVLPLTRGNEATHTAGTQHTQDAAMLYTMWELDIKDFFPSLNRSATMKAVDQLHKLLIEKLGKRVKKDEGLWFALHREHKKLDRLGTGSRDQFHNVPYSALREFLEYELHHNALFCVGNTVLEQIRGVAIGGTCLAQLSSIFTMVQEHRFYSKPWAAQKNLISRHFPVYMIPTRPFRFTDNLSGSGLCPAAPKCCPVFFRSSVHTQTTGGRSG